MPKTTTIKRNKPKKHFLSKAELLGRSYIVDTVEVALSSNGDGPMLSMRYPTIAEVEGLRDAQGGEDDLFRVNVKACARLLVDERGQPLLDEGDIDQFCAVTPMDVFIKLQKAITEKQLELQKNALSGVPRSAPSTDLQATAESGTLKEEATV